MHVALDRADHALGQHVRRLAARTRVSDAVAVATTDLGSLYAVAGITGVLAAARRHRVAVEVGVAGGVAWVVAQQMKKPFARTRPFERLDTPVRRLIKPPSGSSFPSGHAAVAAAIAAVMQARARPGRGWPWAGMAVWVPLTRVHVGVHHPSDVAVGGLVGWVIGRAIVTRGGRRRTTPAS